MSNLSTQQAISAFSALGDYLLNPDEKLTNAIYAEQHYNAWFTTANVSKAVAAIGKLLNTVNLTKWVSGYSIDSTIDVKNIGLILAGNIPLVGFHDVLCVLMSGNKAIIKASAQDVRLITLLLTKLSEIEPAFNDRFQFVDRLTNFDAVIATGSNNTSRYFEYYFGKVPNIIRKNRNSLAVLDGTETTAQLLKLGHDIFDYFGLGCRNVSTILVPADYNFEIFFKGIEPYHKVIDHHKYHNNYDYNKSIYLVNGDEHLDNGFLLLKKDARWVSPLAVLYYQTYDDIKTVESLIEENTEQIQCVVSALPLNVQAQIADFGQSQQPGLTDYADGVDTMQFLVNL
jgi:hypothetical protein